MVLSKQHHGKARRVASCLSLFLALGLLTSVAARAQTQDVQAQDQEAHIDRLENEIQTLSRAVFKGQTPPADIASSMQGGASGGGAAQANEEVRLNQIESELQALTGKVEQQGFAQQELQKSITDLQAHAGGALNGAANGMPPQPNAASGSASGSINSTPANPDGDTHSIMQPVTTPSVTLPNPNAPAPANAPTAGQLGKITQTSGGADMPAGNDATSQYEAAFAQLHDRKYDDAEKGFTAFLAKYPDSNLAPNAQYWLGETYYARNDFQSAARVFAISYQKYPKGPKGPDSLLKLALSLAGLGKKNDACLSLTQLKHEYATGAGPVLARADQEASTLGCP